MFLHKVLFLSSRVESLDNFGFPHQILNFLRQWFGQFLNQIRSRVVFIILFHILFLTLGLDEEKRVGRMVWQKYVDQQYLKPWNFEPHGHFTAVSVNLDHFLILINGFQFLPCCHFHQAS